MTIEMRGSDMELRPDDVRVVDAFQEIWRRCGNLDRVKYFGVPILKNPVDLLAYQQIMFDLMPDVVVETGTCYGGSALYLAHLCQLLGHGHVFTIDREPRGPLPPVHNRLTYVLGDSVAPATVAQVKQLAAGRSALVILDSDHACQHVLAEMVAYQELVPRGGYLIVEDTNINGHPIYPGHGPGPWEAVEIFLADFGEEFVIDTTREYLTTYNPRGYLRRV